MLPFEGAAREVREIGPGAVWLKAYLSLEEQRGLAAECRDLIEGPVGGYVPTVRGGGKMHVRMLSLGRHWNPLTYKYTPTRADHDDAPVPPLPKAWIALASRIAGDAGFTFVPDIALVNLYDESGRMGLHQDKDEGQASIAAGQPVVSISLGDTARFQFGGLKRRDPVRDAAARVWRCVRLRRAGAIAVSRRVAHRPGQRAARTWRVRTIQHHVQDVLTAFVAGWLGG
jgi:alkylated DNA repair dioxygenase AlkB